MPGIKCTVHFGCIANRTLSRHSSDMVTSVRIETGARLHFGPLAAAGASGGKFGGVGMMVTSPGFVVSASLAGTDEFHGENSAAARAAEFVRCIRAGDNEQKFPFCRMTVDSTIPSHAGLGSGTQLGLAVAAALSELADEHEIPVETFARRAGRGLRSAIGLHGFSTGGFLVDGGRAAQSQLGTLVARVTFPEQWRLILVAPPESQGLSGTAEQSAFAAQPPMPQALTAELCRIALMEWLPGLIEADFQRASSAMYEFGLGVGRFFEPAQGGVFAHPLMGELAEAVRPRGFGGVAQTSWGPTTCILCDSHAAATELISDLACDSRWAACSIQMTEPLNQGAKITRTG